MRKILLQVVFLIFALRRYQSGCPCTHSPPSPPPPPTTPILTGAKYVTAQSLIGVRTANSMCQSAGDVGERPTRTLTRHLQFPVLKKHHKSPVSSVYDQELDFPLETSIRVTLPSFSSHSLATT